MSDVRRAVTVRGVVQGVSFRWYTRQEAVRLGLTGWVRNAPDGSVRLEVQGSSRAVDELVGWLHDGPAHARVSSVDVDDIEPVDTETDFEIAL